MLNNAKVKQSAYFYHFAEKGEERGCKIELKNKQYNSLLFSLNFSFFFTQIHVLIPDGAGKSIPMKEKASRSYYTQVTVVFPYFIM